MMMTYDVKVEKLNIQKFGSLNIVFFCACFIRL